MLIDFNQAVTYLESKEVVAIPTETVYGLAGLADSELAVNKIYNAKNRPKDNPLICHFANWESILDYINVNQKFQNLMKRLTPGPVSFLFNLERKSPLAPSVAGLNSISVRVPDHPLTIALLKKINKPLAAPSANSSGKFSPTSALMVDADLGDKIAGVLDGGKCFYGLESTILDCRQEDCLKILRPGSLPQANLIRVLKETGFRLNEYKSQKFNSSTITPGSKYKHYSPETKIEIFKPNKVIKPCQKIVFIIHGLSGPNENIFLEKILKKSNSILYYFQKQDLENLTLRVKLLNSKLILLNNFEILSFQPSKEIKIIWLGSEYIQIARNFYGALFLLDKLKPHKALIFDFKIILQSEDNLYQALRDKLQRIMA